MESTKNDDSKDLNSLQLLITNLRNDLRTEKGKYSDLYEQNTNLQQHNEYLGRSYHQLEEVSSLISRRSRLFLILCRHMRNYMGNMNNYMRIQ